VSQITIGIISTIVSIIIGYLIRQGQDIFRNKHPLEIKVDSKHLEYSSHSGIMKEGSTLVIKIPIIFANRTSFGFDISVREFYFQPKKKIESLRFNIRNRIFEDRRVSPTADFNIESKLHKRCYLEVGIMSSSKNYEWEWDEFRSFLKNFKNNPIIFRFKYVIDSEEKKVEKYIKDFFKKLIDVIEKF